MNESLDYVPEQQIRRLERWALAIGMAATAVCVIGAFFGGVAQFLQSYLLAFLYWIGVALGCMAIAMMHHLTSGAWGVVTRRVLESASKTILLMALLFLPIAFGMRWIYQWVSPALTSGTNTALPLHQAQYLRVPFFLSRAVFYFAVWIVMALLLNQWSTRQDSSGKGALLLQKLRRLSGPGLVIYAFTVSFAAIDWVMSLEPRWYSTIFGFEIITGQLLTAMSFVIVVMVLLSTVEPFAEMLRPKHLQDLGKLLLTFVILWAYMAFSQLLIIWEGNVTAEIPWYIRRWSGGWVWIGFALIALHFFLPFFLLLSRDLKRDAKRLGMLAVFILAIRGVDVFWLTAPEFSSPGRFHVSWMDILLPIGIGGLWCSVFAWQLRQRPLLPIGDPQLGLILK